MSGPALRERVTDLKQQEDELFLLVLPTGKEVICRPLPYSIFLRFQDLASRGFLTSAEIENAVFRACVIDTELQALYPDLIDAGTVTILAQNILACSTPQSNEETQQMLEMFTIQSQGNVYEVMLRLITGAYPTYTPTDLDKLPWVSILKLAGRAQALLLERGVLKEPLNLIGKKKQQRRGGIAPPGAMAGPITPPSEDPWENGIFGSTIPGFEPEEPTRPSGPQAGPPPPPPETPKERAASTPARKIIPPEMRAEYDAKKNRVREADEQRRRMARGKKRGKIVMRSGRAKGTGPKKRTELPPEFQVPDYSNLPPEAFVFDGIDISDDNAMLGSTGSGWDIADGPARAIRERRQLEQDLLTAHGDLFKKAKKKPKDRDSSEE